MDATRDEVNVGKKAYCVDRNLNVDMTIITTRLLQDSSAASYSSAPTL